MKSTMSNAGCYAALAFVSCLVACDKQSAEQVQGPPVAVELTEAEPPSEPKSDGVPDATQDETAQPEVAESEGAESHAADVLNARPENWLGESPQGEGLGLSGIGQGGGLPGGPIGLIGKGGASVGQGFGNGHGQLGTSGGARPPRLRVGATQVKGGLPREVIQRIVRADFGRYRQCYETALQTDPQAGGKLTMKFVIDTGGRVRATQPGGDIADKVLVGCVEKAFQALRFPEPESGSVTVVYPLVFSPAVPTKVGGQPVGTANAAHVAVALTAAGCTNVTSAKRGDATLLTARRNGHAFTVTFVPKSAPADALTPEETKRLVQGSAMHREGSFVLAIESGDDDAAQQLLDDLIDH